MNSQLQRNFELPEINTWRLFNKAISQSRIVEMVESWESHGFRFGSVCIDDGWTTDGRLGDWTPDPVRFPNFRELVDWIHGKGYAVRLWVAPAQIHKGTAIFERAWPESLMQSCALAGPALYQGLGTYRLDPRTSIGQEHIRETMRRITADYDVDAFKVDFPPFYEPDDNFFREAGFDISEAEAQTMIPEFYAQVSDAAKSVKPGVRVCGAKHIKRCQPYFDDIISGDLAGHARTLEAVSKICRTLKDYSADYPIVPWLEMVWGEGSDHPVKAPEWWAGCLEFIANSINFGLKIEHSFQPFDYPNCHQIRALTNLYGPRDTRYKVLAAGRHVFSVPELIAAGVSLDHKTRFLIAPEEDRAIVMHTEALGTSALDWKCRNVLTNAPVILRARNEFWGGTSHWCQVQFEAEGRQVYEIWHEGTPEAYYQALKQEIRQTAPSHGG